ncbi:TetR/AcrR family transcriptional regulator, partial [Streptomyces venezuelae]|uniref:TetR/AcrR family transcriptional regulator n=1 Tax=Streptomyces venezuelae TaxID=54571 RepID=UPI00278C5331
MCSFTNPRSHRTGRPRSTEADTAILEATRAALVELGWSKLTMGDVAGRAGVAKTTLYRRWANKSELVVDAVAVLFDELELPDLGSLQADIEHVVLQFAALLERPETKTALMAVVAESTRDEPLRERIRASIVDRQKRLVLEGRMRAQRRGELPVDRDPVAGGAAHRQMIDGLAGAGVHPARVSAAPVAEPGVARRGGGGGGG